jgi:methylphosphotriester-DNA--protein-cysteine methyltransferase
MPKCCGSRIWRIANMSATSFFRHFRAVTLIDADPVPEAGPAAGSAGQTLASPGDVAGVGYAVGYDSPSQFSREYRRLFGAPPGWDTARLQETSLSASPVYNLFSDATGRTADDGNLRN